MTRRPAFDPARLDELDELMGPPPAAGRLAAVPAPAGPRGGEPGTPPRDRAARAPARPTAGNAGDRPRTVAVRLPRPLYEALVHGLLASSIERPSYAQVVGWTCEDHPDPVLTELRWQTAHEARAPRGRRLAAETVPVALRFRPDELQALDDVIGRAGNGAATGRVTRTAAVIAALRVAVKIGPRSEQGESP